MSSFAMGLNTDNNMSRTRLFYTLFSRSSSKRICITTRQIVTFIASLIAAAWCIVGLTKTTVEPTNQTLLFIYITTISSGLTLLVWIYNCGEIKLSIVDVAAAGFLGWYLLSYYFNDSIAVTTLLHLCFLAVAYVMLRILLSSSPNTGKWLFVVLCVCGIVESITGIRQALGMEYSNHIMFNVTGTFFNPGPYSGYIAIILSLALGYISMRYSYALRVFSNLKNRRAITLVNGIWILTFIIAISAVVLIIIILPSTLGRAAFLAVGVVIFAICLKQTKIFSSICTYIYKNKARSAAIVAISSLLLCNGVYFIYSVKKDSADSRLLIWKISAKVMFVNPIFGVGPGYFQGAYGDMQAEYFQVAERSDAEVKIAGTPGYGFNEYLRIGAETGITGLLLFFFLVLSAIFQLFKTRSYYSYGLLAFLVFAFFSYPLSILPLEILFVLFLAAAGSCHSRTMRASLGEITVTGTVLVGSIAVILIFGKTYMNRIEAVSKWNDLKQLHKNELYHLVEKSPELLPLLNDNQNFLFEYGQSLNMQRDYHESLRILNIVSRLNCDPMIYITIGKNLQALGLYDEAVASYLKAYYIIPHRLYPVYLLAKLYSEIGDSKTARHYALQTIKMTPKIKSSATRSIQREMTKMLSEKE